MSGGNAPGKCRVTTLSYDFWSFLQEEACAFAACIAVLQRCRVGRWILDYFAIREKLPGGRMTDGVYLINDRCMEKRCAGNDRVGDTICTQCSLWLGGTILYALYIK